MLLAAKDVNVKITASYDFEDVKGSDLIVLSAGQPRSSGYDPDGCCYP